MPSLVASRRVSSSGSWLAWKSPARRRRVSTATGLFNRWSLCPRRDPRRRLGRHRPHERWGCRRSCRVDDAADSERVRSVRRRSDVVVGHRGAIVGADLSRTCLRDPRKRSTMGFGRSPDSGSTAAPAIQRPPSAKRADTSADPRHCNATTSAAGPKWAATRIDDPLRQLWPGKSLPGGIRTMGAGLMPAASRRGGQR